MKFISIKKSKINEVLSKNELKSIVGGCEINSFCECYYKKGNETRNDSIFLYTPFSKEDCDKACRTFCQNDSNKQYLSCKVVSFITLCDDSDCSFLHGS